VNFELSSEENKKQRKKNKSGYLEIYLFFYRAMYGDVWFGEERFPFL
jgi:hypothetical protein